MILKHSKRSTASGYTSWFPIFTLIFLFESKLVLTVVANGDEETCKGYQTKIEVFKNNNNNTECSKVQDNVWQCPDLESALERLNSNSKNSVCIELDRSHQTVEYLTKNHIFRQSKGDIKIMSRTLDTAVTVKCGPNDEESSNTNYGMSFIDNERIVLANLNFVNCGGVHGTHYRQYQKHKDIKILYKMNLTAVLNFENVKRGITVRNIRITEFRGYGIVMTDCTGDIQLSNLVLDTNAPVQCDFENMTSNVFILSLYFHFVFLKN